LRQNIFILFLGKNEVLHPFVFGLFGSVLRSRRHVQTKGFGPVSHLFHHWGGRKDFARRKYKINDLKKIKTSLTLSKQRAK
jgi:hypothetical protein